MRILEIGCAEGYLGTRVKALAQVSYIGLEISADADAAATRLDHVIQTTAVNCNEDPFDLVLAFHVLEHIPDLSSEIGQWKRLMKPDSRLVVEVPNGPGHPLLERDANAEHAHQFTPASLLVLLQRTGGSIQQLTTGHFESPVYPDSLRVVAKPARTAAFRAEELRTRFLFCLGERFVVCAAGGDFRNYVEPLLPQLPVAAICDADPAMKGQCIHGHEIGSYEPERFRGLPILIASIRHKDVIVIDLLAMGVPAEAIHGLDEIYGTVP